MSNSSLNYGSVAKGDTGATGATDTWIAFGNLTP